MNKFKYTTDGKKVVIIGDLNQTEKIVQEVFVTEDGAEIPQGERFVEKNLLDNPAKSWKIIELEKMEVIYEKEKDQWDLKLKKVIEEKELTYKSLSARVEWLRQVAKEPRDESFKTIINLLADFISPTEKWVFVKGYFDWVLTKFDEDGINKGLENYDRSYGTIRFDTMRLLSLFGDSKGDLTFKINDYSDGSGSDKPVYFFKSKGDALFFMQLEFDKIKEYGVSDIKNAKECGLVIDETKVDAYKERERKSVLNQISQANKNIEDLNSKLEKI